MREELGITDINTTIKPKKKEQQKVRKSGCGSLSKMDLYGKITVSEVLR
jgi:hypothetical protein